jgi:hypothetical protein
VSYQGYWKPDGFQESGFMHIDNHLEWRSGWELHTGVNLKRDGLLEPFEIYPGIVVPPGTYDNAEFQLVGITNQGAPLSLELTMRTGGFFDGSRVSVQTALRARAGDALNAYLDWSRNDVSLAAGRFVTNLARLRLSWSLSRLYVQALLQPACIDNWSLTSASAFQTVTPASSRSTTRTARRGGLRCATAADLKISRLFDLWTERRRGRPCGGRARLRAAALRQAPRHDPAAKTVSTGAACASGGLDADRSALSTTRLATTPG